MSEETALVEIKFDDRAVALKFFSEEGGIDPLLGEIEKRIADFKAVARDVNRPADREAIKSMAFKIAKSKVFLDDAGKALNDELKAIPKRVDASRKAIRDKLDAWKDEIREPVTKWEEAEVARINKHKQTLARLTEISVAPNAGCPMDTTAISFSERIALVEAIEIGPSCDEFGVEYATSKDAALRALRAALATRMKADADAEELARHRAAQAQREAEEKIRQEAADAAAREERDRLEKQRIANDAAEAERSRSARAIADAEQRAKDAETKAAAEIAAAAKRAEDLAAKEKADAAAKVEADRIAATKLAADRAYAGRIHTGIVADLIAGGIAEAEAKAVVKLIAGRKIARVLIDYRS